MGNLFMRSQRSPGVFHRYIHGKLLEKEGLDGVLDKVVVRRVLFCNGVPVKHHDGFLGEMVDCGLVRFLRLSKKDYRLKVLPVVKLG